MFIFIFSSFYCGARFDVDIINILPHKFPFSLEEEVNSGETQTENSLLMQLLQFYLTIYLEFLLSMYLTMYTPL